MLSYKEFMDFDVESFLATVDDWDTVGGKADDHATTLSDEVKGGISKDFWSGAAANAARGMYKDLKSNFDGATDSARGVADLVSEIGGRWKKYQGNIKGTIEELEAEELTFDGEFVCHKDDNGFATPAVDDIIKDWEEAHEKDYGKTCEGYVQRIADELDKADEADGDLQIVLERTFDADKKSDNEDFPSKPEVDPEAVEAEYTAEIIEDGDPTDEEVEKVEQMMEENGDSEAFSTTLFSKVQADELGDWTAKAAETEGVSDDELSKLQKDFGNSLGVATSSDSKLAEDWAQGAIDYGHTGQNYKVDGETVNMLGYSTLGPILVHGDYPKDFLVPVVTDMTEVQYGPVGQFENGDYFGRNVDGGYPSTNPFDPDHPKWVDPLDYGLTALGKNPEESLAYFDQGLTYEDSTGKERTVLDMMMDDTAKTGDVNRGPLGAALESATTGLSYDAPVGTEPVKHTEKMAALAGQVVGYFGGEGDPDLPDDRQDDMKGMEKHLGDITANYINDFHSELASIAPDQGENSDSKTGHIPFDNEQDARRFLERLGHNEAAYDAVSSTSLGTSQAQIAAIGADGGTTDKLEIAAGVHGELMGYMDQSAQQEIAAERWDKIPTPGTSPSGNDYADAAIRSTLGTIPTLGTFTTEAYNMCDNYIAGDSSDPQVQDFIEAQESTDKTMREGKFEGKEAAVKSLDPHLVNACGGDTAVAASIANVMEQQYDDAYGN